MKTVQKTPETEHIVEYCFSQKQQQFVVRFLDGGSYAIKVAELPKKMLTKKPDWTTAKLATNNQAIVFKAGRELRQIPCKIIRKRGRIV